MRLLIACALLLGACNTIDALNKARTPSEAFYLIKKKDGDTGVNPYEDDPKYPQVYCTVKGVELRNTAEACAESEGIAIPTR